MKKKLLVLMIILMITGCNTTTDDNKLVLSEKETFLETQFINYPKVENIVHYLGIDVDSISVLYEDNEQLQFCFLINDLSYESDESTISYENYIKKMESDFKLTLYDGTISSTFELSNQDYTISITIISDIASWKSENGEMEGLDKIKNNNVIYKIIHNEL